MDRDRWSQGNSKPRDKRQGSQGKEMNLLGRMICGCMHVSVCLCVCVCVRERERERERNNGHHPYYHHSNQEREVSIPGKLTK